MTHTEREVSIAADRDAMIVILIDLQQQFTEGCADDVQSKLSRIKQLILLAKYLGIPLLATLEVPLDRKGSLIDSLKDGFPAPPSGHVMTKVSYDLCGEESIRTSILETGRAQCVVVGAETDVCVMQSVLGLLRLGLDVFVIEDCLLSSETSVESSLRRMSNGGAILTTWKSLYYELVRTDDLENELRFNQRLASQGFVPPDPRRAPG